MISFGKDVVGNLKIASKKEWLVTNGIGGYASSTITCCNMRRYHGLLVAATRPPLGRMVLLSKLEEVIGVGGTSYQLSTNRYPKTIHPHGYLFMQGFNQDPFPKFIFSVEDIILEKEIFMVYGENTTVITYRIYNSDREINFVVSPLIACRDFHWLMSENKKFNVDLKVKDFTVSIKPYNDAPTIYIQGNDFSFTPGGCWYRNFEYAVERARGLDYNEDLYSLGYFMTSLRGNAELSIVASDRPIRKNMDVKRAMAKEIARINKVVELSGTRDEVEATLVKASDFFIVDREIKSNQGDFHEDGKTILAGYHWLSDWGRDAMIAFNGLTLATKRFSEARAVLLGFASNFKEGLIPNNFPEWGEMPQYNSIDASLWFIIACYNYLSATGDLDFIGKYILPIMEKIISSYKRGIEFNIAMDSDGLIYTNDNKLMLTWVNARNEGRVSFPRYNKAVEVQALWFNSLMIFNEILKRRGKQVSEEYKELAAMVKKSFCDKFWFAEGGYLFDSIWNGKTDSSLKANQIIAVSLPYSILPKEKEKSIVDIVYKRLFSPLGIRDFAKISYYYGNSTSKFDFLKRENLYNQGNIWVWLMGYFVDAFLKVNDNSPEAVCRVKIIMEPLFEHIRDTGLGFISEYFDGNEPYAPRGCIAQAWSVAEVLRIKRKLLDIERGAGKRDADLRIPVQEMWRDN